MMSFLNILEIYFFDLTFDSFEGGKHSYCISRDVYGAFSFCVYDRCGYFFYFHVCVIGKCYELCVERPGFFSEEGF